MTWPWILDGSRPPGVFNQISTVSAPWTRYLPRRARILQARSYNEQLAGEATELPTGQIEPTAATHL